MRRRRRRSAALLLALDAEELDLEDERRVRTYVRSRAALAVRQLRWDVELPLRADRHELEGFRPALDDPVHGEARRLAPPVGAVELLPIDEGPPVVGGHRVRRRGLRTRPLLDDLVLEPARERHYAGLLRVLRE